MAYRACRRPLCRCTTAWSGLFRGSRSRSCCHTGPLSLRRQPSPQSLQSVQHRREQQAGRAHRDLQEDPQETGVQARLKSGWLYPVRALQYLEYYSINIKYSVFDWNRLIASSLLFCLTDTFPGFAEQWLHLSHLFLCSCRPSLHWWRWDLMKRRWLMHWGLITTNKMLRYVYISTTAEFCKQSWYSEKNSSISFERELFLVQLFLMLQTYQTRKQMYDARNACGTNHETLCCIGHIVLSWLIVTFFSWQIVLLEAICTDLPLIQKAV